jgi:hypothetical protein
VSESADVFVADPVQAVIDLYGDLVGPSAWTRSGAEQLTVMAERLADGHRRRDEGARVELANWHPVLVGAAPDEIWSASLDDDDFLLPLAREHGYDDVADALDHGDARPDPELERAIEVVLAGDVGELDAMVAAAPDLVARRSHWGHHATLLHHTASNGVEIHRQRVPRDLVAVIGVLLDHGADVNATAHAYGSELTTLGLLVSSGHPAAIGLTGPARDALLAAGAR